ncbi:hypothetical protein [Streptomyces sp. SID3343]|uniref:hypothetical protein n=1 Tax=Streptomyces sp. SID3343 TaxID=2690260 RepID=UPI0013722AA4|nr:hypothetical protein [Streptomyces sp. SID3343]MYW06681.1 hypothetical protein [Streptomyces sp. SID3343]
MTYSGPRVVSIRAATVGLGPSRLAVRRSLESDTERHSDDFDDASADSDLAAVRERQALGELAGHHDPAAVLLAVMGVIMIPQTMPYLVRGLFDAEPGSPAFTEHYADQLRRIIGLLAEGEAGRDRAPGSESDPDSGPASST